MQGKFLCIFFSRFSSNEEGNAGWNSNESGKIRIYCTIILKTLLTMSSPSILNERGKTLTSAFLPKRIIKSN